MTFPQNPSEPIDSISSQLKKQGLSMDKKSRTGDPSRPISGGVNNTVKVNNNSHPNSRSSYDGIFGY